MSSRRKFLQNTSLLTAGAILTSSFSNSFMPSDQVRIGVIGINGMGWSNLTAALKVPGVVVAAICDVDQLSLIHI